MAVLVVGKRQQLAGRPAAGQRVAQRLGLRLLAALIEPFEGDQRAAHRQLSSATRSSMV